MKSIILNSFTFFFIFIAYSLLGQSTISGVVMTDDNVPIPYVNIGIEGENIGTVSKSDGFFFLEIPAELYNSELTFSSIGYETIKVSTNSISSNIIMKDAIYKVDEIVVSRNRLNEKTLGIKSKSDKIQAGFQKNNLGAEIATKINLKKKEKAYPKTLHFSIANNNCDSLFFRINFYKEKNGSPDKIINTKNIYVSTKVEKGVIDVDLTPYNIEISGDFFVSLEWVRDQCPDMADGALNFSGKLFKSIYYRQISQGKWSKLSIAGIGMWLDLYYEKVK